MVGKAVNTIPNARAIGKTRYPIQKATRPTTNRQAIAGTNTSPACGTLTARPSHAIAASSACSTVFWL